MVGRRTPPYTHGLDLSKVVTNTTAGAILKAGTSSVPVATSTASTNFLQVYVNNTATSGDNRGLYLREYISGAGAGGEAARIFTTINNVAAGTAHGAHISLNFGTSGKVSGLGVALRGTLHVPNVSSWTPGTIAAIQAEIFSDGTNSDTGSATEVSFIRVVNDGHANGIADVDDDANLITISGGSIGAGNLVQAEADETKFSHKIRCKVGSTTLYLMACDS
jgi:hypothetical protein